MEGRRRDEEDMNDSLVLEERMIVKFILVPFAIFAAAASRFFVARRIRRRRRIYLFKRH